MFQLVAECCANALTLIVRMDEQSIRETVFICVSKTMLRRDVAERMEEEMTQGKFNEMMDAYLTQLSEKELSDWPAQSREWAEDNGYLNGDEQGRKKYKKFTTREE